MAKRRKYSGILIYNLLMKEVTAINNNLPETRKLSLKERREFISKKLYPEYKNTHPSKIRLRSLRADLVKSISRLPRKKSCDVLLIPEDYYQNVEYFNIEETIKNVLLPCIYIKVDAGQFGETKIFNTREFNYQKLTVTNITSALNSWCSKNLKSSDNIPVYQGSIQLRSGKSNDGHPDSYYLSMILYIDNMPEGVANEVKIPYRKKTKREERLENNVTKYVRESVKKLKVQKTKTKAVRKKIITILHNNKDDIKRIDKYIRKGFFLKSQGEKMINELKKVPITYLKKQFKAGFINQRVFDELLKKIENAYSKK